MFYAYTEEYKHNDCFLKTKISLYNMYKIKLQNVCDMLDMFVVKWIFFQHFYKSLSENS